MNRDATTLEGTLDRVVFSNPENAWSVVKVTPPGGGGAVTAVGNLLGVQPGESLRLQGAWEDDPKFGRQFRVDSYLTVTPATLGGIEKYLGSGLIPGIGPVMAKRLVARFGMETLDVIEGDPEKLAKVPGIGRKRREQIRSAWQEQREVKDLMIFLQSHGVATHHAAKIYKTYGRGAMAVVREDPYRLSAEVYGIGFRSADRIAAALGLPADSPQRMRAGLLHTLSAAADQGHVYLPREKLLADAAELLGVERPPLEPALEALARAGEVTVQGAPGGREPAREDDGAAATLPAVYARPLAIAEEGLAGRLRALIEDRTAPPEIDAAKAVAWFAQREGIALAVQQREAIRRGLTSRVLVITGGPGTGKTTLVRGIVTILAAKRQRVLLAAPTGRAAKRLSEATGQEAKTVHRLLEYNPQTRGFERGPDRPLECDVLILDEASMLDTALAYHTVKAMPPGGRLVLVGDVDQLPSVGPGRVLADLIDSGAVDVVRLTEIFRQAASSLIVVNAHRVNAGEMPEHDSVRPEGARPDADFFFIDRRETDSVLETVVHVVCDRIPGSFGIDPVEGVQVLSPMNRGPLGTESLNRVLRERLNPSGREVARGSRSFRIGDKVMQTRNNYEIDVFNGDLGRVTGIDEENKRLRLTFDGRTVHHDFANLDELALAYACSIHKSQGSEYPAVVVPIHTTHWVMLQRNLLYTALTRAKKLVVLIGEMRAVAVAVRNRKTRERFTLLAERLAAGVK